jgi:hypothetical protein
MAGFGCSGLTGGTCQTCGAIGQPCCGSGLMRMCTAGTCQGLANPRCM